MNQTLILRASLGLAALLIASCTSMRPIPQPVSLREALEDAVNSIKQAHANTSNGKRVGLYPAEAKITFNVTGSLSNKGGGSAGGTIPGGPTLSVNFERTRTNSHMNQIEITLKSIYKGESIDIKESSTIFKDSNGVPLKNDPLILLPP